MSCVNRIVVAVVVRCQHVIGIENENWETDFMMEGIEPFIIQHGTADINDSDNDNSDDTSEHDNSEEDDRRKQ